MKQSRTRRAERSAHDREELVFPEGSLWFGCSPANPAGLYRHPCATGAPLLVRAHVASDERRYLLVRAELRGADADALLSSSEGRFYRDRRRGAES